MAVRRERLEQSETQRSGAPVRLNVGFRLLQIRLRLFNPSPLNPTYGNSGVLESFGLYESCPFRAVLSFLQGQYELSWNDAYTHASGSAQSRLAGGKGFSPAGTNEKARTGKVLPVGADVFVLRRVVGFRSRSIQPTRWERRLGSGMWGRLPACPAAKCNSACLSVRPIFASTGSARLPGA